ncbi:DUF192 domain-containing protein [Rhodovibrio salinarum]|uniref:DUF192 domain-containing protein n=1 Tax=Rhodovibrio salinarum TaxID=1087 RepID=UPI0004B69E84|nr:DUF192 domain-containing protein [Rhodovibrio salinarum]
MLRPLVLAIALLTAFVAPASAVEFKTDTLAIRTPSGDVHEFTVELALTDQQRTRGLMYRREMAGDHGMLFLYDRVGLHAMWMANTYIPLDMLFIKPNGEVVRIAERTVPQSRRPISSGQRVKAVLELRGGTTERLEIPVGSTVLHKAFGTGRD